MRVHLLGTGAADGIPQPFCTCPTCDEARAGRTGRLHTCALVDGILLLDAPPTLGAATAAAAADLRGVEAIAVTHAHHDHWDPSVLLHRSWLLPDRRLQVFGPTSVIEAARHWIAPDSPVELRVVEPGDCFTVRTPAGGPLLAVRVLPSSHGAGSADALAQEAVLYEVVAEDGSALLYGTDTGLPGTDLLAATRTDGYDTVLLDLTFGADGPRTDGHLDHNSFPSALSALREVGAVTGHTDVVAVHLGHHNPPARELEAALATWGARAVPDGTVLTPRHDAPDGSDRIEPTGVPEDAAAEARPGRPRARRVLITGGARSGKSAWAEDRARHLGTPVVYLATGWPAGSDQDWNDRIRRHADRRPSTWTTVETPDVAAALRDVRAGSTVIVDCLALWTTRIVEDDASWTDPPAARAAVAAAVTELVTAMTSSRATEILLVTNEVGSGVVPATASGGLFRDLLGRVNATVSAACDRAVLLVAGRALELGPASATHPQERARPTLSATPVRPETAHPIPDDLAREEGARP